jgi:dTMP kinase
MVVGAGASMLVAVSMSSLGLTMAFISLMGLCAGAVYVLGFTILQEGVDDELRGRTFATLYTLSRLCMLISLSLAPLVSRVFDDVSNALIDGKVSLGQADFSIPGVRITLWVGATIILAAGGLALRASRSRPR